LNKKIAYRPQHRCLEMENTTSINQAYPAVVTNDFNYEFYSWLLTPPMGVGGLLHGKEQISSSRFYDYGARQYDPVIGRWLSVDPLAEEFTSYSPYIMSLNNPLRFIYLDGRAPLDIFRQQKDGGYVKVGNDGGNRTHTYINNDGTTSYYNVRTGSMATVSNQTVQNKLSNYQESKKHFKNEIINGTLKAAETMQKTGNDISKASVGVAVAGLAFEGVGSAPGLLGIVTGEAIKYTGTGIEFATKLISGDTKEATGVTVVTAIEIGVDMLIERAIPGPTPKMSGAAKEVKQVEKEVIKTPISDLVKESIK